MTYTLRHLPHWAPPGQDIFITWRLSGSLPPQFRFPQKFEDASGKSSGRAFVAYDRALDFSRTGPMWLKDPRVACAVITVLRKAQKQNLFKLRAYALMGNHVHVLITPQSSITRITRQIKGAAARAANQILHRMGTPFWQNESFDHWIRNSGEWQKIRAYIEYNPVTAGLAQKPQDWPWSSASNPLP